MPTSQWPTPGGGGLVSVLKNRAIVALNLSETSVTDYFEDYFGPASRFVTVASGGASVNLVATPDDGSGAVLCTTGGAGASLAGINADVRFLSDLRTRKWYYSWRGKFGALDAVAGGGGGFSSATGVDLLVGYVGATSTTNWVVHAGNSTPTTGGVVIPGTTVDTNLHTFEMWYDLTNIYGRVDSGQIASVASAMAGANYAGANLYNTARLNNGGLNARTIQIEWMYWAV